MKLKDYQREDVIEPFEAYLTTLVSKKEDSDAYVEFQRSRGKSVLPQDWCREAWEELRRQRRIPVVRTDEGTQLSPDYISREDPLSRPIPNVCFRVPTGGGKTLLGAAAVQSLLTCYYRKQTGLVLWVVPSEAIYTQTWKALANRESGYRQMLERACGGRVKLLEKDDPFSAQDVANHLCVMLIMLQAGAVNVDARDKRKIFQDSGSYPSFFPEIDDAPKVTALLKELKHLETPSTADDDYRADQPMVRHSLVNVLRIVRPLVILDEGHKAYGQASFEFLSGFSPSFILELSATPNSGGERVSNVLVSVSGTALHREEMIRLPINVENIDRADWKHTLATGQQKLAELQKSATRLRGDTNTYIRPMMLIRVERTGKEQRDNSFVHAEDAREHLINVLGARPEEIRVKSAELDEIGDEELLADTCQVRYVITKDALREGWDCPFAYVLVVLSKTTARTALTQMIGRVLRQPYTRRTPISELNESYVFTFDQEVSEAVSGVRRGLESEGMGDLAEQVKGGTRGKSSLSRREKILRRKEWRGVRIFMPRVLAKDGSGKLRQFDYDRDLLSRMNWDSFSFSKRSSFTPEQKDALERTLSRVTVEDSQEGTNIREDLAVAKSSEGTDELDLVHLSRLLLDVVPNPWQCVRILSETLDELRNRGISEERIYVNRLLLVKTIRDDVREQLHAATEAEFRRMLSESEVTFRLEVSEDERLNWELAEILELDVADTDTVLRKKNGADLSRSLFERIYQRQLNVLEKGVAWYLDDHEAIKWWHRIAVQGEWHLQGWQRNRIYPDFLVCLDSADGKKLRFSVLESKGLHLKGNDDTAYKSRFFDLLTRHSASAVSAGEVKLGLKKAEVSFDLMLETDWQEKVEAAAKA